MSDDPRAPIAARWITHGAIRYQYRIAGSDEGGATPLVLVHGLGVSSAYWRRIQPLLAVHRRAYALDLPGFGRTTRPRALLDSVALAGALGDWLAALGLTRVHLVGHSMGGQVVAEFARASPDRVSRLILVGSTIGAGGAKAPRQMLGLLRDALRESPSLFPLILRDYQRAGPRRVLGTDLLIDGDDTIATLERLAGPLLIVRGSRDRVVPMEDTRRLLRAAPHASFVEIGDAAHAVHWSQPQALARIINRFLAAA